jgi:flagellar protein FliJ
MSRVTRMQPVQSAVDRAEQQRAEQLAVSERRVTECETKLAELDRYEADYRANYKQKATLGMSSVELRDYQSFLVRLTEAIKQQSKIVQNAKVERDACRKHWQNAAVRSKAVEHVVDKWQAEERQGVDRREQRDSDERAQRAATRVTKPEN